LSWRIVVDGMKPIAKNSGGFNSGVDGVSQISHATISQVSRYKGWLHIQLQP